MRITRGKYNNIFLQKKARLHKEDRLLYWVGESNSYCEIENLEY